MEFALIGSLLVLAVIDSTSFGTLVLPLLMLVQPRVRPAAVLTYLATISGFYLFLGLLLTFAGAQIAPLLPSREDHPWLVQAQLGLGIALLVISFLVDKKGNAFRARIRAARGLPPKQDRFSAKVIGERATLGSVIGVAMLAGLIEAASMVPYLAAIAIIVAAGLSAPVTVGILLGYVAVMALPALVLLVVRLLAAGAVERPLIRLHSWIAKYQEDALGWTLGIVGFLVAADAYSTMQTLAPA